MMNPKTLAPQPQPPVDRVPTGQLPSALAELSEAALSAGLLPSSRGSGLEWLSWEDYCSYDGDDE
jgi:bacteriocin leader peptide (microcyclamide/patellamide family)